MKPPIRFQSQLPLRRSYKPRRPLRIPRVTRATLVFRPTNRFGEKPLLTGVP